MQRRATAATPAVEPAIWQPALARVQDAVRLGATSRATHTVDALWDALPGAGAALDYALSHERLEAGATADDLLDRATQLLALLARLSRTYQDDDAGPEWIQAALGGHFRVLEDAVLDGERTYQLDAAQSRGPLTLASRALGCLDNPERSSGLTDRVALRLASVEIAALLIRAAVNLETTGSARHGDAAGPPFLAHDVDNVVDAVTGAARTLATNEAARGQRDHVVRHLCECLRLPVDLTTLGTRDNGSAGPQAGATALDAVRQAWTGLAMRQYAVAETLDRQISQQPYSQRFGSVSNAIAAGALNVLRGTRLVLRPDSFRHRRALGRQGVGLSHAIEAYTEGLHGDREASARAQLIVMTRLVRSVAALTLIDAQQPSLTFGSNDTSRYL